MHDAQLEAPPGSDGGGGIGEMTFEQAMEELEKIVTRLETGEVELEESVDLYDRGARLRAHCQEKLDSARERIEKISGGRLEAVRSSEDDDEVPF